MRDRSATASTRVSVATTAEPDMHRKRFPHLDPVVLATVVLVAVALVALLVAVLGSGLLG